MKFALRGEKTQKTVAYFACFILLGLGMSATGPVLPYLAEQTHSSLSSISFLFTARSLGYLVGAILFGHLFDRRKGHPIVTAALILMAVGMVFVPMIPYLVLLIAVMTFIGMMESGVDIGSNSFLVWIHGSNVAPYMNALHFFFGIGAFLSPVIVAGLLDAGWKASWIYWSIALVILPIALLVARLPSSERLQESEDRPHASTRTGLVILIALGFFLYAGLEVSLSGWLFTYTTRMGLGDEVSAAYLTSAFWATFTFGRLASILLARKYSPQTMLAADLVGLVASMFVYLAWTHSQTALWVGTLLSGLTMASFFPTLMSFAERQMAISASVTGKFFIGASLGAMVVPWLIGQLFDTIGPIITMWMLAVDLLLLIVSFGALLFSARAHTRTVPIDSPNL